MPKYWRVSRLTWSLPRISESARFWIMARPRMFCADSMCVLSEITFQLTLLDTRRRWQPWWNESAPTPIHSFDLELRVTMAGLIRWYQNLLPLMTLPSTFHLDIRLLPDHRRASFQFSYLSWRVLLMLSFSTDKQLPCGDYVCHNMLMPGPMQQQLKQNGHSIVSGFHIKMHSMYNKIWTWKHSPTDMPFDNYGGPRVYQVLNYCRGWQRYYWLCFREYGRIWNYSYWTSLGWCHRLIQPSGLELCVGYQRWENGH